MKKRTEEAWKRCPKCGKIENQIKAGYNASGSQRCKCKECGIYYTIDPKRHEYPEETRELAIKMYYGGISSRGVGKMLKKIPQQAPKLWSWMSCTGFWSTSRGQRLGKMSI